MILAAPTARALWEISADYFKTQKARCHDGQSCRYAYNGQRCVIGNSIHALDNDEFFWLSQFRGNVDALYYGLFGVSPHSKLGVMGKALQLIHDDPKNWGPEGFTSFLLLSQVGEAFT